MKPIIATLLYVLRGDEVLLVYKKRGHGQGKWNGIGGKLDNESPVECVVREAREEAGINIKNVELCGILHFFSVYERDWDVFVYRTDDFEGEPTESEEVIPKWFKISEIPYDEMWEDDREWLPLVFTGHYFVGNYSFNGDKLINSQLETVDLAELLEEYEKTLNW